MTTLTAFLQSAPLECNTCCQIHCNEEHFSIVPVSLEK